jgi:5-methylcytosine-specific restriction enzyme A
MSRRMSETHFLSPQLDNPHKIRAEREKGRKLKKSQWWKSKLSQGVCHYCSGKFPKHRLTMDHMVPIARGGKSVKGNVVVACVVCNSSKKLDTPVEILLSKSF